MGTAQRPDQWANRASVLLALLAFAVGFAIYFARSPIIDRPGQSPGPFHIQESASTSPRPPVSRPSDLPQILAEKGMPESPWGRKKCVAHVATETTPEVVADLGNVIIIDLCEYDDNRDLAPQNFACYQAALLRNPSIARLISEGRSDPSTISGLLKSQIGQDMPSFVAAADGFFAAWREALVSHTNRSIAENDPYYAQFHRYKSPINELDRSRYAVYGSFYVMANLGTLALAHDLLKNWVELPNPSTMVGRSASMDAWLIDSYYQQARGPDADMHLRLVHGRWLTGARSPMSTWNAPWDVYDPMLGIAGVNKSLIPTIDVLAIPHVNFDAEAANAVIQHFIGGAAKLQNAEP